MYNMGKPEVTKEKSSLKILLNTDQDSQMILTKGYIGLQID